MQHGISDWKVMKVSCVGYKGQGTSGGRRLHMKMFYNSIEESQDWNGGREMRRIKLQERQTTK